MPKKKEITTATTAETTAATTTETMIMPAVPPPKGSAVVKKLGPGKLPVTGFETDAISLREKQKTLDWIKRDVDELKKRFRNAAIATVAETPDVTALSFEDGLGGSVSVTLPDVSSAGNRLAIKPSDFAAYSEKGIDLASHTETTIKYELTGAFAEWFDNLLSQWAEQGVALPDGLTVRETVRLSADGAQALKTAGIIEPLQTFTRSPTVKVSK